LRNEVGKEDLITFSTNSYKEGEFISAILSVLSIESVFIAFPFNSDIAITDTYNPIKTGPKAGNVFHRDEFFKKDRTFSQGGFTKYVPNNPSFYQLKSKIESKKAGITDSAQEMLKNMNVWINIPTSPGKNPILRTCL
jgi:hypothetical protein